jgi:hypothetical protein
MSLTNDESMLTTISSDKSIQIWNFKDQSVHPNTKKEIPLHSHNI